MKKNEPHFVPAANFRDGFSEIEPTNADLGQSIRRQIVPQLVAQLTLGMYQRPGCAFSPLLVATMVNVTPYLVSRLLTKCYRLAIGPTYES